MTTDPPLASIIIRCYNESEHIGKLLHGIFEQSLQDFEVILVDSGSTDGTIEIAKQYPVDKIEYISPNKFSFGRALNYGCEAAEGEFCVFASAHVYPKRVDWLEKLLEKFNDEKVALVYGKQRGNGETKFSEERVFRKWYPDEDIEYQESPFCNNANAAIRRSIWEEFMYDESLTGLEDLDWAKRVKEAGYEISYASEAEIVHVHEETPRQILNRYQREAIAHKQIIPEQSFTFLDFLKMFIYNTFSDYGSALKQGRLWGNIKSIPVFRFMQFWGTYRGFNMDDPVTEDLRNRFFYPDQEGYPERGSGSDESDDLEIDYSTRPAYEKQVKQ